MVIDIFGKKIISKEMYDEYEHLKKIENIICGVYSKLKLTVPYDKQMFDFAYMMDSYEKAKKVSIWTNYLIDEYNSYKINNNEGSNYLDKIWLLKKTCSSETRKCFKNKLDEELNDKQGYFFFYYILNKSIYKWTIEDKYWNLFNCRIGQAKGITKDDKVMNITIDPRDLF